MTDLTMTVTVAEPYDATVAAVREALAAEGFGVLTEIDMAATLKAKLDVDIAPQIILGACRPPLAHRALQAEPSIATMLPCNVVVRGVDEAHSEVEALDPSAMIGLFDHPDLDDVAADARARLERARAAVSS